MKKYVVSYEEIVDAELQFQNSHVESKLKVLQTIKIHYFLRWIRACVK